MDASAASGAAEAAAPAAAPVSADAATAATGAGAGAGAGGADAAGSGAGAGAGGKPRDRGARLFNGNQGKYAALMPTQLRVWVPSEEIGVVIGKAGAGVQRLQTDTRTAIRIPVRRGGPLWHCVLPPFCSPAVCARWPLG